MDLSNPVVNQAVFFTLNFASILVSLLFYAIFAWVIASWLIMFGIIQPHNRGFQLLTQMVQPVLKPFRWARIGMMDLSPIVAILALDLALTVLHNGLQQLVG